MSRHHEKEINSTTINETTENKEFTLLIHESPERTKHSAAFEARRGQGLFSTR
jgi:hypothetical protein